LWYWSSMTRNFLSKIHLNFGLYGYYGSQTVQNCIYWSTAEPKEINRRCRWLRWASSVSPRADVMLRLMDEEGGHISVGGRVRCSSARLRDSLWHWGAALNWQNWTWTIKTHLFCCHSFRPGRDIWKSRLCGARVSWFQFRSEGWMGHWRANQGVMIPVSTCLAQAETASPEP
jgi:hypothetical protein